VRTDMPYGNGIVRVKRDFRVFDFLPHLPSKQMV